MPQSLLGEKAEGAEAQLPDLRTPAVQSEQCHQTSKARLRLQLYLALFLMDVLCLVGGFLIANAFRFQAPLHGGGLELLGLLGPAYVAVALSGGAYSVESLRSLRHSIKRSVGALALALAGALGAIFYLKAGEEFSRLTMAIGSGASMALLISTRFIFDKVVGRRFDWQFINEVVLVDGVQIPKIENAVVLFAEAEQISPSLHDPKLLDRIGKLFEHADRVIVACPPARRAIWATMLKGVGRQLEMYSPELQEMGALGIGSFGGTVTAVVDRGPLSLRGRVIKRLFDLAVAIPAVVVLAPLFLLIALAIKLDSQGPVFFRQPRVGQANRTFWMWKFRSMRTDAADTHSSQHTLREDGRVTRVGRFLRRTSLDELPQLFNVLDGSMSLVGPRPHAIASLAGGALFWEVDNRYWHRHAIKPGMTGLAQIRGFRGSTFERSDLINRLQSDLEYLSGWTLWRDIAIILSTVRVMVHNRAF